jgi:hemerythrin
MGFEWADSLATGVEDIDSQHKELINRVNALLDACNQQKENEEIGKYLSFLREYVAYHFAAEERTMTEQRYPGLKQHEEEHEAFKARVHDLYRSYTGRGVSIPTLVMTIRSSCDWLVNHIMKTDRAMADFLKTRGAAKTDKSEH